MSPRKEEEKEKKGFSFNAQKVKLFLWACTEKETAMIVNSFSRVRVIAHILSNGH